MKKQLLQAKLLSWFQSHQRKLPWREHYEPYQVWISEIMLQQTQVNTVLPYFDRWMKALPTLESVANADEELLLKLWEGLGYYSRVKNIQKAAQILVKENEGQFYEKYEDILTLPGIGPYSAGAIASIAFQQDKPVVDGNVIRVLARLKDFRENVKEQPKRFWTWAEELLPTGQARAFNQGFMELGALLCTPKNPQCSTCPLQAHCLAYAAGTQADLPNKGPSKSKVPIQVAVAVIQKEGEIFIQKRQDGGLMAGLWEFPGGKVEKGENLEVALHREIAEELGISITGLKPFMQVQHAYTKYQVDLHCYLAEYVEGRIELRVASESKWVKPSELTRFAFPAANVKLIEHLLATLKA